MLSNSESEWSFKNAVGITLVDTLLFANSTSTNFFILQDHDNVVSFYLLKCEYYSLEIIQYFMSTVSLLYITRMDFFLIFFFFLDSRKPHSPKTHFVDPGEGVKSRLSQALTRDARPDSNSRPAVQISNPLPSHYVPWGLKPRLSQALTRGARPDSNSILIDISTNNLLP